VAEFAVMTMLTVAKDFPAVVRAQDRREFLDDAPGTRELAGSKALILGQGAIGHAIDRMLRGFVVETETVRRSSALGWKDRLGTFDWIVLALPGTAETRGLIGAAELAAMKREAVLINFARADIIDEAPVIAALRDKRIAAAVLDVTDPEPLPPGHPLWALDNAHLTMHLSGIPTPASLRRAAERFARNCEHFRNGEPLEARVDLKLGY
jgi:phosphoglycerate dehydrogenase-like enzyme